MAFTEQEKVKLRAHMGYLNVSQVQTFALGVPAAVETQFLIEGAMNRVLTEAELKCRELISILDSIEGQMVGDLELLSVIKIGGIEVNPQEQGMLKRAYKHWQAALGNLLGIVPNPYDQRFLSGGSGINVRVSNG